VPQKKKASEADWAKIPSNALFGKKHGKKRKQNKKEKYI